MNASLLLRRAAHSLAAVTIFSAMLAGCNTSGDKGNSRSGDNTSGTATSKSGGSQLTVGFSQIGAENPWRTAETNSIREEAKNRGINLQFSDAQGKQEQQVSALKTFIAKRVDAIILAPKVETGWEPVLKQAKAANIPVILVDRGVTVNDDSLYTTLIASDFVEEGRRAGEWLANKTSGTARIVELQGTAGAAPANDRHKGFADAIAKHPGMQIVRSQSGDFNRAKGKEVMEAFLKADPAINAVYAHNDDMGLGAIQAIEEAGKKPGTDILVVSIDGMKAMVEAIAAGKANCTVECNPLLGPAAFDAVAKAVAGEELPKKTIVEDALFDETNAAQAAPERKY